MPTYTAWMASGDRVRGYDQGLSGVMTNSLTVVEKKREPGWGNRKMHIELCMLDQVLESSVIRCLYRHAGRRGDCARRYKSLDHLVEAAATTKQASPPTNSHRLTKELLGLNLM